MPHRGFASRSSTHPDGAKALTQFDRKQADLAVLRTDERIPARARAIAILEHDVALLLSPGNKKIKLLAELKKKKIAVLAENDNSIAFVRSFFDDRSDAATPIQPAGAGATLDKLFSAGFGAVIAIEHASKLVKDKSYEQAVRRGGFTVNAIDEAQVLARKIPGISDETLSTGMLSSSPQIPNDELDTIGLQWLLVAQTKISTTTAGELARII
jgi:hypothetical protein